MDGLPGAWSASPCSCSLPMPESWLLASMNFERRRQGSFPPFDRGYLIAVIQLPPGASLARTDEVNRRAVEIALAVPGVASAVNVVGFSGATFTNAPNSGALFVVLKPFSERAKDPGESANAILAELYRRFATIQEALIFVVPPPPVQGIGNAGGFRMMVEDRAGRGPQALQAAVGTMMRRAGQMAGLTQVFSLYETATPELYLDIDRTKAQMLGIAAPERLRRIANLHRLPLCERLQSIWSHLSRDCAGGQQLSARSEGHSQHSRAQSQRKHRSARLLHHGARHSRTLSCAALQSLSGGRARRSSRPGYSQSQAMEIMERLASEILPDGFSYEWTTLAFQQRRAGNTAMFAFVLAVTLLCFCSCSQRSSKVSHCRLPSS